MDKRKLILKKAPLILALCLLLLTGCNNSETGEAAMAGQGQKFTVAVTILPEKNFVEAVCGDLVNVIVVVPPGKSPESYEMTPREREELSNASIYFVIGVPVEEASVLPQIGDEIKVVDLASEVVKQYPDRTFAAGERDPHIWLSPKRAAVMVSSIAREMSSLDEANAAIYNSNAKNYLEELQEADSEIKSIFASVQNKRFIAAHPAFGYFADEYGLTMYALEEEGKESTPQHLQDMIDLAKAEGIKTIFSQTEVDNKQPEAFAEEIGGQKVMLEPLAEDYIVNLKSMAQAMAASMK